MKYKRIIEIVAESQLEEQFLLDKFPGAWWNRPAGINAKTTFHLPISEEANVQKAYDEFKEVKRRLKK
ncbi:MAG: hypothetical protein ACTSX1_13265 [Candidatus Heimdallarchaeaceae archaeon]